MPQCVCETWSTESRALHGATVCIIQLSSFTSPWPVTLPSELLFILQSHRRRITAVPLAKGGGAECRSANNNAFPPFLDEQFHLIWAQENIPHTITSPPPAWTLNTGQERARPWSHPHAAESCSDPLHHISIHLCLFCTLFVYGVTFCSDFYFKAILSISRCLHSDFSAQNSSPIFE